MARRKDHTREELKEMMIAEALQIMERDGQGGLTARSLAKAVGYTPGTIYNLFESMDGVSLALNAVGLERLLDKTKDLADSPLQNKEQSKQRLRELASLYYQFKEENTELWRLIFSGLHHFGENVPEWYLEKLDHVFKPIEEALQFYTKDAKSAARLLWSHIHGLIVLDDQGILPRVAKDKKALQGMIDKTIDLFLKGLAAAA